MSLAELRRTRIRDTLGTQKSPSPPKRRGVASRSRDQQAREREQREREDEEKPRVHQNWPLLSRVCIALMVMEGQSRRPSKSVAPETG